MKMSHIVMRKTMKNKNNQSMMRKSKVIVKLNMKKEKLMKSY